MTDCYFYMWSVSNRIKSNDKETKNKNKQDVLMRRDKEERLHPVQVPESELAHDTHVEKKCRKGHKNKLQTKTVT